MRPTARRVCPSIPFSFPFPPFFSFFWSFSHFHSHPSSTLFFFSALWLFLFALCRVLSCLIPLFICALLTFALPKGKRDAKEVQDLLTTLRHVLVHLSELIRKKWQTRSIGASQTTQHLSFFSFYPSLQNMRRVMKRRPSLVFLPMCLLSFSS